MGNESLGYGVVGRIRSRVALFEAGKRDRKGAWVLLGVATRDGDEDALRELHAIVEPSPAQPCRKYAVEVQRENHSDAGV